MEAGGFRGQRNLRTGISWALAPWGRSVGITWWGQVMAVVGDWTDARQLWPDLFSCRLLAPYLPGVHF